MNTYSAYGLCIASEVPLREFLREDNSRVDAAVHYRKDQRLPAWTQQVAMRDYYLDINRECARFWFKDTGAFVVTGGTSIDVFPVADSDERLTGLYIEGMITAMLLYQRGLCVLHASVVQIGNCVVAFLGPVGAGKSSLAAAMHSRRNPLISDDNAAIRIAGDTAIVAPAYPYLKLFPAIADTLGYKNGDVRELHPSLKKIGGAATRDFIRGPKQLHRLYFLRRDQPAEIQPLESAQLMLELIRNSVPTRWGVAGDEEHLRRCSAVARRIEAFTVRTFDTLETLPDLAERIEQHCSNISKASTATEPL